MANNERSWSPPQLFLSALLTTLIWSAVGFSWFGYGFNWMTHASAVRMVDSAVAENLADICVAQARSAPDSAAALVELGRLADWKRRDFVEKANWATMPGSTTAQSGVATRCVEKLLAT